MYAIIGADNTSLTYSGFLNGVIDELRIWNTVRSIDDIRYNYTKNIDLPQTGLIAYYKFDQLEDLSQGNTGVNDIRDYSGNGLHGDAVGGPIIDDNAAPLKESNNALHFDGVNDIVELTSNPNLTPNTNAISVESWIYCDELRHAPIAGKYNSINLANDPFTGISWLLQVTNDGKLEFDVCGNKNASIYRYKVSNNAVITAGQWIHVAATFSTVNQDIKLYVNGIEVAGTYPPGGQATITNIFDSFTPLRLGKIIGGSSQPHFKGTMDEFRLWNYVRSQEQILSTKNCQLDGNENGLVLYYTFDQGRASGQNAGGNILQDKSLNLFNGQLIGHSLTGSSSNFVTGYNQVSSPCEADSIGPNDLLVTTEYHLTGIDTFNNVYVEPGATLICDGTLYVTENILVKQFGEITHTTRFENGANIIVDGKLTIDESGAINVTGKGLLGGYNGSVFSPDGEAYDLNGQIISGAGRGDNVNNPGYGGAGGSYGGLGANIRELGPNFPIISNALYGLIENPDFLGSGGGGSPCGGCNQAGGNGGGKIKITANLIDLFGKISANGANSTGGGGSGGSIILEVGKITGHGTIEAKGGSADWNFYKPGSGGGGRISIKYDSLEISTNQILASGGVGPFNGCTGTIYLKDSQKSLGDIVINGSNIPSPKETPLLSNLIHFNKIELINQARVLISANSNITIDTLRIYASKVRAINTLEFTSSQYIDLDQNGELYIDALGEITFPQFNETYSRFVSGKIYILEGSKLNILNKSITIPPGITLIKDGTFGSNDIIDDLTIRNLGILTHSNRHLNGLNLTISNNLTIDAGGSINVTEKGLYGGLNGSIYGAYGEVFDTVGNITGISCSPIAGASYGGWGGRESTQISTNHPYGLIEDPSYLGSGGSAFCDGYGARGGNGGGRVTINAQNIIVNGSIQANGGNGVQGNMRYSGGGSGGSIKIISENISGSGIIQANGGRGSCQYCSAADYMSGGGGGRIAVFYSTNAIPLSNFQASGASFGADIGNEKNGGAGTIFLKENNQSNGSLIISNANIQQLTWTPYLTNENTLNALRIEGKSKFVTSKHITLSSTTDLFIQNGDFHIDETINFTIPAINQNNLIKGSLHISEHAIVNLTNKDIIIPSGFSLIKDGKFGESDEINSLIIQSGGNITHSTRFQKGLFLKSKGIIEIQSGASIDCYGKGLLGGYGKSNNQWISDDSSKGETYDQNGHIIRFGHVNSNVGFGGSYGGSGGSGSNFDTLLQPIYGDKNFPAFLGSGGSATLSTSNNLDAGNGGGRVIIQASELRVNGMINVDGANAASLGGGGGSGGTVLIFTPNINGSGTITANGGFGRCFPNCASWGGDGGGGRIAIYTQNPLFPENKVVAS
ncbi:MAG: LamG domain-containing protein [Saprospiraceae bacterium]|nr:LamG domain-containing protein [Saprospiraceae bacterium]